MYAIDEELRPILEMFAATIRRREVVLAMRNWKEAINNGILNFGRKEPLNEELSFNTLFYTHPNPTYNRSLNRVVLNIDTEIAGVVTHARFEHAKFNHLRNEMLIVKAVGKWDYEKNDKFKRLRFHDSLTLCIPENVDSNVAANARTYTTEVAKQCKLWLLTSAATARA